MADLGQNHHFFPAIIIPSKVIEMSDHTCTPTSSEESSKITKTRSVVLTANRKYTWSIASAVDVPYNRAL